MHWATSLVRRPYSSPSCRLAFSLSSSFSEGSLTDSAHFEAWSLFSASASSPTEASVARTERAHTHDNERETSIFGALATITAGQRNGTFPSARDLTSRHASFYTENSLATGNNALYFVSVRRSTRVVSPVIPAQTGRSACTSTLVSPLTLSLNVVIATHTRQLTKYLEYVVLQCS